MQTNKRWGATAVRHGGEDTWQEMSTDKNRHGMYCTRRERGRGNGVREDEVNTRSEQKKSCSCQGEQLRRHWSKQTCKHCFLLVFERPLYTLHTKHALWMSHHNFWNVCNKISILFAWILFGGYKMQINALNDVQKPFFECNNACLNSKMCAQNGAITTFFLLNFELFCF